MPAAVVRKVVGGSMVVVEILLKVVVDRIVVVSLVVVGIGVSMWQSESRVQLKTSRISRSFAALMQSQAPNGQLHKT